MPDRDIMNASEQTINITTNVVGAMGAGVAKSFRDRHMDIYSKYRKLCKTKVYTPNSLLTAQIDKGRQVLLFPTKIHWRDPSPVWLIEQNLNRLSEIYERLNITSIASPPMGMSNGWLKGDDRTHVWELMCDTFAKMDIECTIYHDE